MVLRCPNWHFQVILSVNPWVIHRDPDIFGQDSHIYNPDRWLQGDTKRMDSFLIHVRMTFALISSILMLTRHAVGSRI